VLKVTGYRMQSGIKIICKKVLGQVLITEKPYCIINDTETKQLERSKESFIPLQPNLPYKITIQFPYSAYPNNACGTASITTQLGPDEIQAYEYKTPFIVYHSGSIKRK
jgi:hypothetical protein